MGTTTRYRFKVRARAAVFVEVEADSEEAAIELAEESAYQRLDRGLDGEDWVEVSDVSRQDEEDEET